MIYIKKRIAKFIERKTIDNLNRDITKYVKGDLVLDYGCGKGSFIYKKHQNKIIYGIDIKQHKEYPGIFIKIDKTEIPFKNNLFDCLVYAGVIQYIPDYNTSLREINRVLKKGGRFIIATVNRKSLLRRLNIINPAPKPHAGEHKMFSFDEISYLLLKHGFKVQKITGTDVFPMPSYLCSNILIIASKIR